MHGAPDRAMFETLATGLAELMTTENLLALLTLTLLEVVLGIDNIVFIAILCGRLPESKQGKARTLGLSLAMFMRIGLLLAIGWIMSLQAPLFDVLGKDFSGRDLILLGGGLFLIGKATYEIHHRIEGPEDPHAPVRQAASFAGVLVQILLLDLVFSLDSVITAVGMVRSIPVMIVAVILAVLVMLVFAGPISRFILRHPTMKMLALAFLVLIGVVLVIDGWGEHINKGYIYFAMGFSLAVEMLNLWSAKNRQAKAPVTATPPPETA